MFIPREKKYSSRVFEHSTPATSVVGYVLRMKKNNKGILSFSKWFTIKGNTVAVVLKLYVL